MSIARSSQQGKPRGTAPVLLTAGGLAAGFAAAACCALPLLLGTLGLGSSWLFTVAAVAAPHRTAILLLGSAALALAAALWWRQRTSVCDPGAWCARPGMRFVTLVGLVIGAMLLVAGYIYV